MPKARDFFGKKVISKSTVIPNPYLGSDVEHFLGERNKTIVTAIRFEKEKCADLLIRAFASIHKDYPEYRLILYGTGSLLQQYKDLVKELLIDEYVYFPGYVTDVARAVRKEGIFVLPSRYEGIPNTLIEVLAVGIPTISADCSPGGPRFLLKDGESGLLFPVGDVIGLEKCLRLLIQDESLYRLMQERSSSILSDIEEPKIRGMWINAFSSIIER